ncbi:TonB-dependent receptor [Porticoccaceae bacterium LTM1]|nr:TonB-dependent receptor [Porticoccaceae bacterium LTM1]
MNQKFRSFKRNSLAVGITAALMVGTISAHAADESVSLDIKEQSAGTALLDLGEKAGVQIMIPPELGRNIQVSTIVGQFTLKEALDQMLKGTGLTYEFTSDSLVTIKASDEKEEGSSDEKVVEELVVTGSRVTSNPAEMSGQVITYDAARIRASGATNLAQFMRQIPQNSNGDTDFFGSTFNSAPNYAGGSTANLRGIGSQATLVLVDGHRMGHDGFVGGVTDISSIPLSRVERIEVLLDGASAIYGADAVGGVINIITKKDYQGVIANMEYEEPSAGGFNQWKFGLDGAFSWDGGRLGLGFERSEHSGLYLSDRDDLAGREPDSSSPDWPLGNTRPAPGEFPSLVGGTSAVTAPLFYTDGSGNNITVSDWTALDPADQAGYVGVDRVNAPRDWDGSLDQLEPAYDEDGNLILKDFSASGDGSTEFGRLAIPVRESNTFTVSLSQDLTEDISFFGQLIYENRDTKTGGRVPVFGGVKVSADNPFNQLGTEYRFGRTFPEFGSQFDYGDTDRLTFNFNVDGKLGDWDWTVRGAHNQSELEGVRGRRLDGVKLNYVMDNDGVGTDGIKNVFLGPDRLPPLEDCTLVQVFSSGTHKWECPAVADDPANLDMNNYLKPTEFASSSNYTDTFGGVFSGAAFSLPAGDVVVSAGFEWQKIKLEAESSFDLSEGSTSLVASSAFESSISRDQYAFFIEGLVPLMEEGSESLDVTFSGRYDSYDKPEASRNLSISGEDPGWLDDSINELKDPGADSTWALGLIWQLNDHARLRLNKSTSFVAPQLNQLISLTSPASQADFGVNLLFPPEVGFSSIGLSQNQRFAITGGNPQLESEHVDTFTASLELTPGFAPGLTFNAAWHETNYNDKIYASTPSVIVVGAPLPPNVIRDWNGENPYAGSRFETYGTWLLNSTYTIDARAFNVASQTHRGMDYRLTYELPTDNWGEFFFNVNVAQVFTNELTLFEEDPNGPVDLVGEVSLGSRFFAVPEYSGSAQVTWSYRGLDTSLNVTARSDVERFSTFGSGTEQLRFTSEYPTLANLTFSYDFDSGDLLPRMDFLSGVKATFGIQNITDDFTKTIYTQRNSLGEILVQTPYESNAQTAYGQGRLWRLSLSKEF